MYDHDYERDVLLTLRILKYLQQENEDRMQEAAKIFKTIDLDELYALAEYTFWDIFSDVAFMSDEMEEDTIVAFSHPEIDRFFTLMMEDAVAKGLPNGVSFRKVHDIVEFFLCGTSYSVREFHVRPAGAGVTIELQLSQDCYDPLPFFNSIIDMLLYVRQEARRMEASLQQNDQKEDTMRKEAA